jgi:hypothetical protein
VKECVVRRDDAGDPGNRDEPGQRPADLHRSGDRAGPLSVSRAERSLPCPEHEQQDEREHREYRDNRHQPPENDEFALPVRPHVRLMPAITPLETHKRKRTDAQGRSPTRTPADTWSDPGDPWSRCQPLPDPG